MKFFCALVCTAVGIQAFAQSNCQTVRGTLSSVQITTYSSHMLGRQQGRAYYLPGTDTALVQNYSATGQLLNQHTTSYYPKIMAMCMTANSAPSTQILCRFGTSGAVKTLIQTTDNYNTTQSCPVPGYAWEDLHGCFSPMPPLPPPSTCNASTVGTVMYNCYTCVHTTAK